jgi:hypothetical protein
MQNRAPMSESRQRDCLHAKIDGLCEQRDRLKKEQPAKRVGALGGRNW